MSLLFYITLLAPFITWLLMIVSHEKNSKKYLNYNTILYFILSIIWIFFWISWYFFHDKFFVLDKINIVFYCLILILSFLISVYAISYFWTELEHKVIWWWRLKQYNIFINLFVFAMLIVSTSANIIIMWIWIEATTIFTTFLISFYNTKSSWEAAWKYVIICWIWVTIWLFWLFMMIYAGVNVLNFTDIWNFDLSIVNNSVLKLAFVFILIWFWTKMWLFPFNTWLPDAHWKWSTPISAFMSSILLPLAFYIILRSKNIIDIFLQNSYTWTLLIIFWLWTLLYAWFVLLIQKHFKRALAYSSSENMGIIAFAFWLWTPLSQLLWLLHIVWHSFLKSASFMSLWNVLLFQNSGQFDNISNLPKYMKITSILVIFSLLLLIWLPPSPLFLSEIWLVYEAFKINIWYAITFIFSLILVTSWIVINFWKLFIPKENVEMKLIQTDFKLNGFHYPIIILIILSLVTAILFMIFYIKGIQIF